jgi:hypothetical protein
MSQSERERIIEAARLAGIKSGRDISLDEFTRATGITEEQLSDAFPQHNWRDIVKAITLASGQPPSSGFPFWASPAQLFCMIVVAWLLFLPVDGSSELGLLPLLWFWL